MTARCNFGTLETRILRGVFIVNMNNKEGQNELCRSTKTPEEVYLISLSYERGDKYPTTYVSTTGGTTPSSTTGGAFQIKREPVGAIRGGYLNSRQRGRGSYRGRPGHHKETGDATIANNLTLPQNTWQDIR